MLNTGRKVPVFYPLFVYFSVRSVFKKYIFLPHYPFFYLSLVTFFGWFSLKRVLTKLQNSVSGRKESVSDPE